jgi:hypothetical protein
MSRRVIGIPDQDGIIRIRCGEDTVEIIVASFLLADIEPEQESSPSIDPEPARQSNPKIPKLPPTIRPIPMFISPMGIHYPGSAVETTVDLQQGSESTIAEIVKGVTDRQRSPHLPDPDTVFLRNQHSIDIHALARLADRMRVSAPDVMVGIVFDGDG